MHIWDADGGEGSKLGIWPEPRVLPWLEYFIGRSWGIGDAGPTRGWL